MEEKDLELEETLENPQDYSGETEASDSSTDEPSVEELQAQLEKEKRAKEQLYARLKKLEEKLKVEKIEKVGKNTQDDKDLEAKLEFIAFHGKDLTKEEIQEVFTYAKAKGVSYEEALKSPVISAYLEKSKAQRKAEEAQVDVSSGKSDIEKKFTEEQLKSMSLEELKKIIPK
mgnify:CR=1 FL=1